MYNTQQDLNKFRIVFTTSISSVVVILLLGLYSIFQSNQNTQNTIIQDLQDISVQGNPTLTPSITQMDNDIPEDRKSPPQNWTILKNGIGLTNGSILNDGTFQVAGYCSRQGKVSEENGVDWFCVDGNKREKLTPDHLDEICTLTYNVPQAKAIRDGTHAKLSYRWRCYGIPRQLTNILYPPCGPVDCNRDNKI
ncbi:MAG: hypothetical protein NZZ41_07020, partial [Candidatus Dojkabacteria bacterium]|nr:hypothetical protein [Candidatus Dojkabacteria bacterium]